jgi:hypothetical protein
LDPPLFLSTYAVRYFLSHSKGLDAA